MSSQRKLSIYVSGAHSVGKTTLHEALLKNEEFSTFGFKGQEEIARIWIKKKGYTQETFRDPESYLRMQYELIDQQLSMEASEVSEYGGKYNRFFWDRGVIDSIAYTRVYHGREAADAVIAMPEVEEALSRLKKGQDTLVFVPQPHEDFVSCDGVRPDSDMEEIMRLHHMMISILDDLRIYHKVIDVFDLSDRENTVIDEVKRKWPWLSNI